VVTPQRGGSAIESNWFATSASRWTLLVRLMIGLVVFCPEGLHCSSSKLIDRRSHESINAL
jgi:hypothetical protein